MLSQHISIKTTRIAGGWNVEVSLYKNGFPKNLDQTRRGIEKWIQDVLADLSDRFGMPQMKCVNTYFQTGCDKSKWYVNYRLELSE